MISNKKFENTFLILFTLAITSVCLFRNFFGVELTDEIFYVSESYLMSSGATPFGDSFFVSAFQMFLAPFVSLYSYFVGNNEGILLFARIISYVTVLSVIYFIYRLIKPHVAKTPLVLSLCVVIPFAPYSLVTLSYNGIAAIMIFLSSALLVKSLFLDGKSGDKYIILAGCFFSFAVAAYPITLITGFFVGIVLLIIKKKREALIFLSSMALFGILLILILVIRTGGILEFVEGLNSTITYAQKTSIIKKSIIDRFKDVFMFAFIPARLFFIFLLISSIFIFIVKYINFKLLKTKFIFSSEFVKEVLLWAFIASAILQLVYSLGIINTISDPGIMARIPNFTFSLGAVIIYAVFVNKSRSICSKLLFPLVITFIHYLVVINSSGATGSKDFILQYSAGISIIILYYAIKDFKGEDYLKNVIEGRFIKLLFVFFACLLTIVYCNYRYEYVYREGNIKTLTYMADEGIYKGIFTSYSVAENLIALENELNVITSEEETVLFLDCVPFAYLMVESTPFTPSTWDLMAYSYGYNDASVMMDYFDIKDDIPDKIIYIDTGRDELLSIDFESYEFNAFVNENYEMFYINEDSRYPIKAYSKK